MDSAFQTNSGRENTRGSSPPVFVLHRSFTVTTHTCFLMLHHWLLQNTQVIGALHMYINLVGLFCQFKKLVVLLGSIVQGYLGWWRYLNITGVSIMFHSSQFSNSHSPVHICSRNPWCIIGCLLFVLHMPRNYGGATHARYKELKLIRPSAEGQFTYMIRLD